MTLNNSCVTGLTYIYRQQYTKTRSQKEKKMNKKGENRTELVLTF